MAKVIVGMSGGVDSSVSAHLLLEQGHEVIGVFMKNWEEDDDTEYCSAAADLADAQAVCDTLGIELKTINFAAEYWDNVFEHFLAEYKAGRTPNPDILCNTEIKFKAFLKYAEMLGAEKIAMGHYVRSRATSKGVQLLTGLDPNKDQSYFLHALSQAQIQHALFPVGELEKPEVRKIAEHLGLATAKKKDSTGICFIGERKFKDFLEQFIPAQPGEMMTPDGKCIGTHQGLMFYTIGQRQGLGIGGQKDASEDPWYVADKDIGQNQLIVVQGDHPLLYKQTLSAAQPAWIAGSAPEKQFQCTAKIRYRQQAQPCKVSLSHDGFIITFEEPQRAVTPGQSVVLYDHDVCLGGGIII